MKGKDAFTQSLQRHTSSSCLSHIFQQVCQLLKIVYQIHVAMMVMMIGGVAYGVRIVKM